MSIPPTIYSWRFADFPIHPSDNAIVGVNDGKLYLQLVEGPIDTLVCTAHNDHTGESQSGYIRLVLTEGKPLCISAVQDCNGLSRDI